MGNGIEEIGNEKKDDEEEERKGGEWKKDEWDDGEGEEIVKKEDGKISDDGVNGNGDESIKSGNVKLVKLWIMIWDKMWLNRNKEKGNREDVYDSGDVNRMREGRKRGWRKGGNIRGWM